MSFQQGLSGLNAASKNLDAIGNNVANSNTVGYKSASTAFADVYATSLAGGGATGIGIGVAVASVAQNFSQGNIIGTSNPLDMAINGNGFFRLSRDGEIVYSRNGQFHLDRDGYIVNATGANLTGLQATNGLIGGAVTNLRVQVDGAGGFPQASTAASIIANLDAEAGVIDQTIYPFDPTDPATYTNATSMTLYDDIGVSRTVATYFVKTAPNTWEVYATEDGALVAPQPPAAPAGRIGALTFAAGRLDAATLAALPFNVNGVTLDFEGSTQVASGFGVTELWTDGYPPGRFSGLTISDDGIIQTRYSNGRTEIVGQIRLDDFTNPHGLQPLGNNLFAETPESGQPIPGTPMTGRAGSVNSGALEESNVDLTAELVNMITAQRVYQANAQTIKTQDQIMQTLVNLR